MSKLRPNKINFDDDDFVVEFEKEIQQDFVTFGIEENTEPEIKELTPQELEIIEKNEELEQLKKEIENQKQFMLDDLLQKKQEAQEIIENAQKEAQEIISKANEDAKNQKDEIIENAQKEAQEIIENSKTDGEKLIETSKEEIENSRIEATKNGYEDGYKDALEKLQEEFEEKIKNFDTFCNTQYEIKEKIIKSASKDILNIIFNISKKILSKELDEETLKTIIKNTISLLQKKENVNIIVSEKYAKLLYQIQKKEISNDELEIEFENFNKFEGFDLSYNPKLDEDTIIIENLKERYDSSIQSQLDVIIRNILENSKGQIDLGQYIEENETE